MSLASSKLGRIASHRSRPRKPGMRPRIGSFDVLERWLLMAGNPTLTGVPNWVSEGPAPIDNAQLIAAPNNAASGSVESIAVNPFDATQVYLGAVNGGVWKSTTAVDPSAPGAVSWAALTDKLPALAIGSVAFDPLDAAGNTLFAGTGSFSNGFQGPAPDGVLRTTDGGATWSVLASATFAGQRIKTILPTAVDVGPAGSPREVVLAATVGNSQTNWAGGGGGLFESTDNGNTFTRLVSGGLPGGYGSVTSLIVDPNNSSQFYAAIPGTGVYRGLSDAAGSITWARADTNITGIAAATDLTLATHAAGGTVLYAAVGNANNITGVFSSADSGNSWTALAAAPAPAPGVFQGAGSLYNQKINMAADPVLNNVVYLSGQGSGNIFRYNPAGAGSWQLISPAQGGTNPHSDSRELRFLNATTLLESDDGGIYFLQNPTDEVNNKWQSFNGNLGVTETVDIAYDTAHNLILAGTQDNGTDVQTAPNGTAWNQFSGGDGGTVRYDSVNSIGFAFSNNLSFFFRNATYPLAKANNVGLQLANATTPAVQFSGLNPADKASANPNAATAENDPFVLNTNDPTRILIGRTGLYEGSGPNTGDIIADITPAGMGTATALIYGGFRAGAARPNIVIVGDGNGQLDFRGEAGAAFTPVAGPGTGAITALAVDPQDWRRVYVVEGSNVYVTADITSIAANPFTDITNNLDGADLSGGSLKAITLFDNTSAVVGDSIPLVAGFGGVYRLIGTRWTRYGDNFPNTVVSDVLYVPSADVLVAGTFGRGEWEVQAASTSVASSGILTINGDQDFPGENDTIRLVRDANNPTLLDVYQNSSTPIASYPIAVIQRIDVNGLGGNDTLIVDRTNGPVDVPDGVHYDGGTHNPPGVDRLSLLGAGAAQATFTRDPATPDAGTLVVAGSTTTFVNSQQTDVDNVVQLTLLASSAATGTDSPDGTTANAGTFVLDAATIVYTAVTRSTISDVAAFTFITPNDADVETVDVPSAGRNRVLGDSGGIAFTPLTFFNVAGFTLDSVTNKVGGLRGDRFTVDNPGGPAFQASGLQTFSIDSGPGNDVLTIDANDLRLPVAGGSFTFDAGSGAFADGTPSSNLRGLTSLDRLVVNADADFLLADRPHVLGGGGPVPDDTAPREDLLLSNAGGGLGTLNLIGVESAVLNGGVDTRTIDGSGFGGALVARSGDGTTTLLGGAGQDVLYGGSGADTLVAGDVSSAGHANDILGGGGVSVLVGGSGAETFVAGGGAGTTSMIGGTGSNAFSIANPAGTVNAPIGGFEVIGNASASSNALDIQGGGGPGYTQTYTIGAFPAAPGSQAIDTLSSLGLDVPTQLLATRFDGTITTANSFATSGTVAPVTQSIRVAGLSAITDGVASKALSAFASPGSTFVGGGGSGLAAGTLQLATGAGSFAPIHFSNKARVSVFGAAGALLAQYPTPILPASKPLLLPSKAAAISTIVAATSPPVAKSATVAATSSPAPVPVEAIFVPAQASPRQGPLVTSAAVVGPTTTRVVSNHSVPHSSVKRFAAKSPSGPGAAFRGRHLAVRAALAARHSLLRG